MKAWVVIRIKYSFGRISNFNLSILKVEIVGSWIIIGIIEDLGVVNKINKCLCSHGYIYLVGSGGKDIGLHIEEQKNIGCSIGAKTS